MKYLVKIVQKIVEIEASSEQEAIDKTTEKISDYLKLTIIKEGDNFLKQAATVKEKK